MKNRMLRSLSLLGISLVMALSVSAQEPKVKTNDKETKYKSEDLKIKDKKDEDKYKSNEAKIKDKKDETKYKSEDLKIKDEKDERKVKAKVKPMKATKTERTEIKNGETHVRTTEHIAPISVEPAAPEPVVAEQVAVPEISTTIKKTAIRKHAVHKSIPPKAIVAGKTNTTPRPKYIVRTKIVRDTVFVPSPPERIVSTEYLHDTVTVTRVDTFVKVQKENTYTGYRVPRGNFKKVKLKKDKDGDDVWMKRKTKD